MPSGTLVRWNSDKGFGFIKPDDGGEDIFCHRTSIEDGDCFIEGSQLSYTKGWDDRKNKERADNVTGGSQRGMGAGAAAAAYAAPAGYAAYGAPPPGYPGAVPAGRLGGTVKRWNEASGFGFIKPDDGTEDIFVHRTSIEGAEALPDGARVTYVKEYDGSKSKAKAEKCQIVGGVYGGAPPMPAYGGAPYGGPGMFAAANYGQPPPMYGSPYAPPGGAQPAYGGSAPSAYGAPAYAGGAPPAYAGGAPPAYGAPPAAYGAQQPAYGAPPVGAANGYAYGAPLAYTPPSAGYS